MWISRADPGPPRPIIRCAEDIAGVSALGKGFARTKVVPTAYYTTESKRQRTNEKCSGHDSPFPSRTALKSPIEKESNGAYPISSPSHMSRELAFLPKYALMIDLTYGRHHRLSMTHTCKCNVVTCALQTFSSSHKDDDDMRMITSIPVL